MLIVGTAATSFGTIIGSKIRLFLSSRKLISFQIGAKNDDSDSSGTSGEVKLHTKAEIQNSGFLHAFIASFSVIIVSELGDKTFFIAAIMAMKHPRITVFGGAIAALALMTVLSGGLPPISVTFQVAY